jgi:hypothetical protein
MVVIDGMQHQIFKMPTECGILHSDIHPRDVYTRNLLDIRELKKRILPFLKVSKIPRVVQIRFRAFWEISLIFHAKPIAEFTGI